VSRGIVDGYASIQTFGRTQAVVRIDVLNEGRLAAIAQGTVTIMEPRA
jgi:acyl-coenzyme A thioesterase PaaI-like protein